MSDHGFSAEMVERAIQELGLIGLFLCFLKFDDVASELCFEFSSTKATTELSLLFYV